MLFARTTVVCSILALSGALAACDSGDGGTVVVVPICAQGETQACTCASGAAGAQACNASNNGWLPCVCAALPDGISLDVDVTPDVAPDAIADVAPDAGPDLPDAVADVVPDAVADVVPDAVADVVPDAVADVVPDAVADLDVTPDVAPSTLTVTLENADGQVATSISATHNVGASPCPQRLGTVVAVNSTASPAALTLSLADTAAVAFSPTASVNVAAGATIKINADFTCANTSDISTTLTVKFSNQAANADTAFPLALTVNEPTALACSNPSDQTVIGSDPNPADVASSEGQKCFLGGESGDAEFFECTKTALLEATDLSTGCAHCYAGNALCSKNNCLAECLGASAACQACRDAAGCTADFLACDGTAPGPCDLKTCDTPPAPDCAGKVARTYKNPGTCSASGGVASCSYAIASQTTCAGACDAGVCVAAANPYDYVFGPKASFVTAASIAPEGCCFDFDGDGKDDNGLNSLLGLLAQFLDADVDTLLQESIDAGELVVLFEHYGLQNATNQASMELRTVFGQHLSTVSTAKAGNGNFEASVESFHPSTGIPLSNVGGNISGGFLQIGPGSGAVHFGVSAFVSTGANGQGLTMSDGIAVGLMPIAVVAEGLNEMVKGCACLGLGGGPIAQVITTDPSKLKLGCTAAFNASTPSCTEAHGEDCQAVGDNKSLICPALGILPFDQDADGDGQKDSLSFGFYFSAVSANILGVY
ncbi:MAG: hypothetical protein R3F39_07340 [Myxococcota bacterium]